MTRRKRAPPAPAVAATLEPLFSLRGVAIVGGSPGSYWTRRLLDNLALARPAPRVFLVHPGRRAAGPVPAVPTLAEAPFAPDLAVLLVPVAAAAPLLRDAAAAGAKAAIVVGDPPPPLDPAAAPPGLLVLGPSSLGALSPSCGSFPFVGRLLERPPAGDVALVSESGGIAIELLRAPLGGRFGWSHVLCVGAGDPFGAAAAVEALAADPATRVIGAYLESLADVPRWARAAEAALRAGKPVVALRGRHGAAAPAAGDSRAERELLAGVSDAVPAGLLRHWGVAEVPTLEAFVETLVLLARRGVPGGRRTGVVALSASTGRLAADALCAAGLELPGPAPGDEAPARRGGRERSTVRTNPLDLTGRVLDRPQEGVRLVREFAADRRFDVVLFAGQPPRGDTPSDRRMAAWAGALAAGAGTARLALAVQPFHGPVPAPAADPARPGNPFLAGLAEASAAVAAACVVGEARRASAEPFPALPGVDPAAAGAPLIGPPRTLSEPASLELLGRYGIPVPPWRLCTTATAASRFAHELGRPVAVKAAMPELPGKAAADLVRLGLDGDAAVRTAFHDVTLRAQAAMPHGRLLGATVMAMFTGAARLVAGLLRHERLGMLVVARRADLAGGRPPAAVRSCPLRRSEALGMAAELGLGVAPAAAAIDTAALADVLVRLARLGADLGAVVAALCLGPLVVAEQGRGCAAVDASVVLRPLR